MPKTTMPTVTCALYVRVSTKAQRDDGDSLAEQKRQLRNYARGKEYKVLRVIEDTKSGKNMDRPGFRQLAELMESGKLDRVLILDNGVRTGEVESRAARFEGNQEYRNAFVLVKPVADILAVASLPIEVAIGVTAFLERLADKIQDCDKLRK